MSEVEITTDGKTIWVNDEISCIGRFSRFGIDIHTSFKEQNSGKECLLCTHSKPNQDDWERFIEGMKKFHNVEVDNTLKPEFLLKE